MADTSPHAGDRDLVFYLDGLRYSFRMAALAGLRLRDTVEHITCLKEREEEYTDAVVSALLDAWTLVDICHRVRELVQQTPQLSRRTPQVQVFLRATEDAKELRHYVQHFRSGITGLPRVANPVWGALSWVSTVNPMRCYTVFTGTVFPGVEVPSCSFDTQEGRFAHVLALTAAGRTVDLAAMADHLAKLRDYVEHWMARSVPNVAGQREPPIFTIEAKRSAPADGRCQLPHGGSS